MSLKATYLEDDLRRYKHANKLGNPPPVNWDKWVQDFATTTAETKPVTKSKDNSKLLLVIKSKTKGI